ncbi:MAG: FAD-dependent oxidoreductase [Deltaproteobacteria bacterium]|nr:FAD-dependent oxidoreductase [Deltaproteobacteria bacterium]
MYDRLLQPLQLRHRTVRNRIVMPAMHMGYTPQGEVTQRLIDFYSARSRGGAGLIVVGACTIDEFSGGPFFISLRDGSFVPGMHRLAHAIQEHGALAAVQLLHAGRYVHSFLIGGKPALAPSAVPSRYTRETPRELTYDEIREVILHYASAAARAVEAGFDAVEVIASAGYLVAQFLSPVTNLRTDDYGGKTLPGRARFGLEVARAVRAAVGDSTVVGFRLAGNDFVPGGNTNTQAAEFARLLEAEGVDYVSVTGGWHETRVPQIIAAVPQGAYAYLARGVRERVGIPVFAANRINHPGIGERILADGLADAVCFGRALIADPDLPRKAIEGRQDRVVRCVGCGQGCFDKVMSLEAVTCMVNPLAGREGEPPPAPCVRRKKVLVVGGGPAGLMAAATAAERGHEVILHERVNLGGQLALAAASPGRRELRLIANDLEARALAAGVSLRVGQPLDADAIVSFGADAVVFATGGRPLQPRIPGSDGPNVQHAWDVLAGRSVPGRSVAVIGGGAVGVDVARHIALLGSLDADTIRFLLVEEAEAPEEIRRLARRGTRQVTLVEMRGKFGADIGVSTRWSLMQDLERYGVTMIAGRKVIRITPEGLELEGDGPLLVTCDTVVLAAGAEPERTLYDAVASRLPEAHLIGDAKEVRRAFDAVAEGYAVGSTI